MKLDDRPLDGAANDTLSVYLALEKRVKNLENELNFAKLNINVLYMKIKELKAAREPAGTPEEENSIVAWLRENLSPKLDELIEEHMKLLRDLGGPGKTE